MEDLQGPGAADHGDHDGDQDGAGEDHGLEQDPHQQEHEHDGQQSRLQQLDDLRRTTIDSIEAIQRETEYPTTKSKLCSWCEYRSICPLFKEDAAAPTAPPAAVAAAPRPEARGQLTPL